MTSLDAEMQQKPTEDLHRILDWTAWEGDREAAQRELDRRERRILAGMEGPLEI